MYLHLTCNVKTKYLMYKILSYKPTQKWHLSCAVLKKGHLGTFTKIGAIEIIMNVLFFMFSCQKWY